MTLFSRRVSAASPVRIEVHRQPESFALDWQQRVKALRRKHPEFGPGVVADLKAARLLDRCLVMMSDQPRGPLVVRFVGLPTIAAFGYAWAQRQLGQPLDADPHQECAEAMVAVYDEAAEGDPVFNQCLITGLRAAPIPFCHMVIGWRDALGCRAIFSAIAA